MLLARLYAGGPVLAGCGMVGFKLTSDSCAAKPNELDAPESVPLPRPTPGPLPLQHKHRPSATCCACAASAR